VIPDSLRELSRGPSNKAAKLSFSDSILHSMMETVEAPPSGADSFASLLAGLAAARHTTSDEWNVEHLVDDVATISYEQALRAQTRYPVPELDASRTEECQETVLDEAAVPAVERRSGSSPASAESRGSQMESRRSASITIRLTRAECDQLHERAVAAGMTVSAYLRSCTFEVEALRAQVKQALAQFSRAAGSELKAAEKPVASVQNWRSKFFPRWGGHRSADESSRLRGQGI
jgi:hypothetical protein